MNQIPDLPNLLDKELAVSYNLHMSQKNLQKMVCCSARYL